MLQPPHAKDHSNTPSPHSTSPFPSLTAPRRCGPSPSTSPTLAETARRAALTASNNMSPGKATCLRPLGTLKLLQLDCCLFLWCSAWLRWHPNGDISSCCAAMGMFTWTVWAASRIRSQCVPPMTPTRRPGRAWRRQRRRLGAEVPLSLRLEAAMWVSGKQDAGAG